MCAQPCRWNYTLVEEKRPDVPLPIEVSDLGTFILSSKDMCMIEHIPALMESGIYSFKIEGRMKSAYYTAVVSNTYRMAIDAYTADPAGYTYDPAWLDELESVSHREYCTGYFFDNPMDNPQLVTQGGYLAENAYLATALSYDEASGHGIFMQRNKFTVGNTVELLTPGKVGQRFVAEAIFSEDLLPIESTPHPYMIFRMPTPFPVKEGDILRMG